MFAVPLHSAVPVALVTMRLMMQVLVADVLEFGTGRGAPYRQPCWNPVHVPGAQSVLTRQGLPAFGRPTHAGYSVLGSVPDVQLRMLPASAADVAAMVIVCELQLVTFSFDCP